MRVDMDELLRHIRGTEMYKRFRIIAELEQYTLLTPPYEAEAVKELFLQAERELDVKLCADYYHFLKCCDGGLLFTNELYSVLAPGDEESDLVEVNRYLRAESRIPEGWVAIGCTNYGAYILVDAGGGKRMSLWDWIEEKCLAEFEDLYAWLDDILREALFLLSTDDLPVIDGEDYGVGGDG